MNITDFEKEIQQLTAQVQKAKARSLARFMETRSPDDLVEADRSHGAEWALEELRRRVRAADPSTPDWVRPMVESREVELRPRQNATPLFPDAGIRRMKVRR